MNPPALLISIYHSKLCFFRLFVFRLFQNLQKAHLTHSFHCCAFKFPSRHDPRRHAERMKEIEKWQQQCTNKNKDANNLQKLEKFTQNNGAPEDYGEMRDAMVGGGGGGEENAEFFKGTWSTPQDDLGATAGVWKRTTHEFPVTGTTATTTGDGTSATTTTSSSSSPLDENKINLLTNINSILYRYVYANMHVSVCGG